MTEIHIARPQPLGVGAFPDALRLVGTGPAIDRYHAWLADPDSDDAASVGAGLGDYAPLAQLVAYTIGQSDTPPACPSDAPAELRALVSSARASAALEDGDAPTAVTELNEAIGLAESVSPALAAELRISAAEVHHMLGNAEHARLLEAGEALNPAMAHYYDALQLVSEHTAPTVWAGIQLDLATAQLSNPMKQASDQLRLGIAAQALRACRTIFTASDNPAPWSMATLNLANALVYLPSTHQGDNLVEAVELYEEILASGVREDDPAGKARLLANQGNALAHLGIFDQAKAKLVEARFLFESQLDHDGALMVRGIMDEIVKANIDFDEDDELAALARKAEQMSRMPAEDMGVTSGMGVTITASAPASEATTAPPPEAQKRAKVTILSRGEA